jgi:spore coat protein A
MTSFAHFGRCLLALALVATGFGGSACIFGDVSDQPRVELPLPIPPVLQPTRSDATADYYTITQKPGLQRVFPPTARNAAPTPIEGYEGLWPGPTLEVRRGRPAVVTQINALDHPVAVHNHGHKVEAASDGHPLDMLDPGGSRDYHYPNDQLAGTFWLHDHSMGATSLNIWRGLAGFYIIRDDFWDSLNLPSGEYDIPLLLQDRSFNADNTLYYPGPPTGSGPQFGDTMCVNGVRTPRLEVAARKYLFRILNGSDHRIYRLSLQKIDPEISGEVQRIPFKVVASDGSLLPASVERDEIVIAPAERYAIVVDFSGLPLGTSLMLRNGGPDATLPPRFPSGVLSVQLPNVMRFDVTHTAPDASVVPDELLPITRLNPADAVVTRRIELGAQDSENAEDVGNWFINHQYYDPARIDFHSKLNSTEIWELVNLNGANHVFHVHLTQFQVLANGAGADPPPEWRGWKDSVLIRPFETIRIIMKWEGFKGVYVVHCHVLAHEDHAMMAQVEVGD